MDIEARMVNVQRLFGMLKGPQENVEGDMPLEQFKEFYPEWP
jgi:ABC-type multidrug transport system fused ATPase/permease subunit